MRNQRERVVEAVADVCSVAGYGPMTVEDIIVTAGISRRSFYDLYRSKADAFLQAIDTIVGRLFADVDQACARAERFEAKVEAGLAAVLGFFAVEFAPDPAQQPQAVAADGKRRRLMAIGRTKPLPCRGGDLPGTRAHLTSAVPLSGAPAFG